MGEYIMTDIDYEAVVRQLIHENEKLRMKLYKLYMSPIISYEEIAGFIRNNYQFLLLGALWLTVIIELIGLFIRSKHTYER